MIGVLRAAVIHAQDSAANRQLLDEYGAILEAMDQSERRAHTLIEMSPVGVYIVDDRGIFVEVNPACAAMLGYSQAEMVGRPHTMILAEDQPAADANSLLHGKEVSTEYVMRTKEGEVRVIQANEVMLFGSDGRAQRASYVVDITEQQRRMRRLSHAASHDALTGLPNRVWFADRVEQAHLTAARQSAPFAVLQIDLDRFKAINDTYGHAAGDDVLRMVATRMRALLRASDTVARLGGDEFAVLLPEATEAKAQYIANKLRSAIRLSIDLTDHRVSVDASIGIALYPEHGEDPALLLNRADVAMYSAKAAGGGVVVYANPGHGAVPALRDERPADPAI
jgi:diguanylate cyclase (GGDEF)-like protein/PAS domain S-box-containing protein